MTYTLPKWLIHLIVVTGTVAGVVAGAAAAMPSTAIAARWVPAIATGAGIVSTIVHQVLGVTKAAPTTVVVPSAPAGPEVPPEIVAALATAEKVVAADPTPPAS